MDPIGLLQLLQIHSSHKSSEQAAELFQPGLEIMCAQVVFTLFTSYQQANGPRAADGRDSPVQETES